MKIIEVIADAESVEQVVNIAQHYELYYRLGPSESDERRTVRILVGTEKRQKLLDALQGALGKMPDARLDSTFLTLVFLWTIVTAIGLLEDNVAVVSGTMVIAPLPGSNIAI